MYGVQIQILTPRTKLCYYIISFVATKSSLGQCKGTEILSWFKEGSQNPGQVQISSEK